MASPHVSSPTKTPRKFKTPEERHNLDQPTLYDHYQKEKPQIARTLKTAARGSLRLHPATPYVLAGLTGKEGPFWALFFTAYEGRIVSRQPKAPGSEDELAGVFCVSVREYREILAKLKALGLIEIEELTRDRYRVTPQHQGILNVRWKPPVCRKRLEKPEPAAEEPEPEPVPVKLHCPLKLPCPVTQLVEIGGVLTNKVGPEPAQFGIPIPKSEPQKTPPPAQEPSNFGIPIPKPEAPKPPARAEEPSSFWNTYSKYKEPVSQVESFIINELHSSGVRVSVPEPAKIIQDILMPLGDVPLPELFAVALLPAKLRKFHSALYLGVLVNEARKNYEARLTHRRPPSNGHKPEVQPTIDSRQLEYAERILRDPDAGPNERAMAQGLIDAYRAQQGES